MFKKTKKFFHTKYVRSVEFFTNHLMSFTFRMMCYLMTLKGKDLKHVESLATRFAAMAASLVRAVIVLKGKDPDYVELPSLPPPLEVAVDETKSDWMYDPKNRKTQLEIGFGESWVKKPAEHPVLLSRAKFEAKPTVSVIQAPAITKPLDQLEDSVIELQDSDLEVVHH